MMPLPPRITRTYTLFTFTTRIRSDFLGPPSAVRRHIIRNGNGRAADNLPVAVLVPKAWNDRVEPVPARFVGRIGKIIEQVRACDGRDRNVGRIDHAADEAACLRRHTAARLKDALENVPLAIGGPLDAAHCPAVRVRDVRCFHEVRHADIRNRRTDARSEEHTSELQSLMRISYAVFCLKKKNINQQLTKY